MCNNFNSTVRKMLTMLLLWEKQGILMPKPQFILTNLEKCSQTIILDGFASIVKEPYCCRICRRRKTKNILLKMSVAGTLEGLLMSVPVSSSSIFHKRYTYFNHFIIRSHRGPNILKPQLQLKVAQVATFQLKLLSSYYLVNFSTESLKDTLFAALGTATKAARHCPCFLIFSVHRRKQ